MHDEFKYNEKEPNSIRGIVLSEQVSEVQAKILKELLADGRQTDSEIAEKIGSTKEVVKKNYEKMQQMGIITGATTHINYKSFGYKEVAYILINVDPKQEDQLIGYLQKMPEVFSVYRRGVKGNIDVVTILKTLEQLNEFKDTIKRHFFVLEMKTAIWTDVKEMNENLTIIPEYRKNAEETTNYQAKTLKSNPQTVIFDQIDQKIADKLSENGRVSMESLSREIGISSDTAKRRYQKLRENGVLKVTIQINPIKIGYQAICIFFAVISSEKSLSIVNEISKIPDVISIMKTTGDYDLQIWVMIKNISQLLSIQEKLRDMTKIKKIDMEITEMREKWPTPRQYISTF
jgi:DNA-binding Lrp family transcriptional regulator